MARDKEGFTPKQRAYDIAMGWIKAAASRSTGDLNDMDLPPAQERELVRQLAKLHNRLLDQSGLDGNPMGEE